MSCRNVTHRLPAARHRATRPAWWGHPRRATQRWKTPLQIVASPGGRSGTHTGRGCSCTGWLRIVLRIGIVSGPCGAPPPPLAHKETDEGKRGSDAMNSKRSTRAKGNGEGEAGWLQQRVHHAVALGLGWGWGTAGNREVTAEEGLVKTIAKKRFSGNQRHWPRNWRWHSFGARPGFAVVLVLEPSKPPAGGGTGRRRTARNERRCHPRRAPPPASRASAAPPAVQRRAGLATGASVPEGKEPD